MANNAVIHFALLAVMTGGAGLVMADSEVFPAGRTDNMPIFPANPSGQRNSENIRINVRASCVSSNLRSVGNPLAPEGCLNIRARITGQGNQTIDLQIPSRMFDPRVNSGSNVLCPAPKLTVFSTPSSDLPGEAGPTTEIPNSSGWSLAARRDPPQGGGIFAEIQTNYAVPNATIGADGSIIRYALPSLTDLYFRQTGLTRNGNGMYFGANGAITVYTSAPSVSDDGSQIDIYFAVPGAAFPGQPRGAQYNGFCGGFYSPLMLFFDKDRPRFSSVVEFPLLTGFTQFHWPEKGAKGYFLALDRNGNRKIDSGDELFGVDIGSSYANGFERLRELDSNHDGVIDARDKRFSALRLWRDKDVSGTSEPAELVSLDKMGVTSLSLAYDGKNIIPVSNSAQLRETANFTYLDRATGRERKGKIVDVWLSPGARTLSFNAAPKK